MNKKKLMIFGLIGLFSLMVVSAVIVTYWEPTKIDMGVTDSFTVYENTCDLNVVVAGDGNYKLCLFEATNNLNRDLDVSFELKIQKKVGEVYENLINNDGVYVGFSEDLQYAYNIEHNSPACTDWNCAETWLLDNADWFDWYLTQDYEGYYNTSVITNHGGNSTTVIPLNNGVFAFTETVPENYEIHSVIYVGSGLNLEAGDYRVVLKVVNVAETQ